MQDNQIYTKEELNLFDSIENGNYQSISQEELEKKKTFFQQISKNTIEKQTKKKSTNIRLFENDLISIKTMALEEGLPYQTFLSSMIHKIAIGKIRLA